MRVRADEPRNAHATLSGASEKADTPCCVCGLPRAGAGSPPTDWEPFVNRFDTVDDPRRRWLVRALAAGLFSGTGTVWNAACAQIVAKLPADRSIFRVSGAATVNGAPATVATPIRPGDRLRTERNSELIYAVSDCAMLLREGSELALEGEPAASPSRLSGLRMLSGKVLAVFAPGQVKIQTATANAEIRGTGVYIEADQERTYFCTCFGVTEVSAKDDPDSRETVAATHHNKPLFILAGTGNRGNSIRPAPFVNHTDQELALIEALVGRTLPAEFAFPTKEYDPSRTRYR
jgi:hypothetical protein